MAVASTGAQWASDSSEHPVPAPDPTGPRDDTTRFRSAPAPRSRLRERIADMRNSLPRGIAISVSALLIAFLLPLALPAPRVDASSSCTGWSSTSTAPTSVRVYLADKDRVVQVAFQRYVAMVMASGEFPTWLPPAVLEAGATAVKQYAWYYAMKGHHRSNYVTSSGACYDVRNDTNDQLFRTVAHPTDKQYKALNATWGLTLRKGSRFFLTGYRAGVQSGCGSDADGWRLYAKSMVDCARKGWDRQQIQQRYYAPRITFVWRNTPAQGPGDTSAPTLSVPSVEPTLLQPGAGRVRVQVAWSGADDSSGIASYRLQERINGGAWQRVPLGSNSSTSIRIQTTPGTRHQFRVMARDKAGNATGWVEGATFVPQVTESDHVALSSGWSAQADKDASGKQTRSTTQKGATATYTFEGSAIGVMATRGPSMGRIRISVDGVVVDVIDLKTAARHERRVVYTRNWKQRGKHTIRVEALGTSGRPRVDIDAFVLLH